MHHMDKNQCTAHGLQKLLGLGISIYHTSVSIKVGSFLPTFIQCY